MFEDNDEIIYELDKAPTNIWKNYELKASCINDKGQ